MFRTHRPGGGGFALRFSTTPGKQGRFVWLAGFNCHETAASGADWVGSAPGVLAHPLLAGDIARSVGVYGRPPTSHGCPQAAVCVRVLARGLAVSHGF